MNDAEYEVKDKEYEDALKPKLTNEFLATLVEAARTCGWSVDHIETQSFVHWCFEVVDKKSPKNLSPFMDE